MASVESGFAKKGGQHIFFRSKRHKWISLPISVLEPFTIFSTDENSPGTDAYTRSKKAQNSSARINNEVENARCGERCRCPTDAPHCYSQQCNMPIHCFVRVSIAGVFLYGYLFCLVAYLRQ